MRARHRCALRHTEFSECHNDEHLGSSRVSVQIADTVSLFFADPLGYVLFAFDWTNDPELHVVKLLEPWSLIYDSEWGPDKWACEFLDDLGAQIRANKFDGKTPVKAIREAVGSGHGIGKSALAAWVVQFI